MKVFISYNRDKDEFDAVSEFRKHFANELRQIVPESTVFQDTENIGAGDRFPEKLRQEIVTADVLLVLVSPAWLARPWCRSEFELFSATEFKRGRSPRVLPVLWVVTDALNVPGEDLIAQQLAMLQYADWRDLRHEDWKNPALRRQVAKLAERAKVISTTVQITPERLSTYSQPAIQGDVLTKGGNVISTVFHELFSDWEIWQKPHIPDAFGACGRKYAQKVEQLYNSIRILGMNAPVPLRSIYVRVNILEKITARHQATVRDLEAFFQRDKRGFGLRHETKSGLDVVNTVQKVIVLGKPGAGKTSFLKWLSLIAIDGLLSTPRVPIFVSLKEWSDSEKSLLNFIVSQFDTSDLPDPLPYVRRLLHNGKCLILLDGFDEVTGDISTAIAEIKQFSNTYFQNQFVLTCRIAAYDYVFEQFTEVEMADFEEGQIRGFIDNWFGSNSAKANRCWSQLQNDAAIRELAAVPLLLTLLCLAFDEQMTFPTNRAELYRDAVAALLTKWDSSRNISRQNVYKQLTPRRKESLLGYIAYQSFQQGRYFLPKNVLETRVAEYIQHLTHADYSTLEVDSEAMVKSIEAHHGLLVERAKGIYSFSHLTLQEFFTACHIFEHWSEPALREMLVEHLLENDWREVILLAAGMLTPADQLLIAIRRKLANSISRDVDRLLKDVRRCITPSSASPSHVKIMWGLVFIFDRLRALRISGELRPDSVPEHSRDLSIFVTPESGRGVDALRDLDRILDRTTSVARLMDPSFNPRADFEKRTDIRSTMDFARALDYVRARDRLRFDYSGFAEELNKYLYGTELLYECLTGECYITKAVRAELLDSLLIEPWQFSQNANS